jgi:hypothetical protein
MKPCASSAEGLSEPGFGGIARWSLCHNARMQGPFELKLSDSGHSALRGERLSRLSFRDALEDCIALSELTMDMIESFSSREELIWIQNGFRPQGKGGRAKSRRQFRRR